MKRAVPLVVPPPIGFSATSAGNFTAAEGADEAAVRTADDAAADGACVAAAGEPEAAGLAPVPPQAARTRPISVSMPMSVDRMMYSQK